MNKIRYMGKFESYDDLPVADLPDNAVMYKEVDSIEKLSRIGTVIGLAVSIPAILIVLIKRDFDVMSIFYDGTDCIFIGVILQLLSLIPHELIHGLTFPAGADVQFWQALRKGALFVTSTEPMKKSRFIGMSLAPNIVFGVIPILIYVIFPITSVTRALMTLGILSVMSAGGDLYNVYNTLRQVPNGAYVVLSGIHTYWYCKQAA